MKPAIICFFIVLLGAMTLRAEDSSALINEALDKTVSLEVDGVLPQVIKSITDKTGVPIEVPQRVYDLLPWGEQTNVRATIRNQTLRQALTAITHKLGLNWELGSQAVKIEPRQPLDRLGRRATIQELEAMDLLSTTPLPHSETSRGMAIEALVSAIDHTLADLKSPFTIDFRPGDKIKPDQLINIPRNATLSDALKEVTKQTDATWYPWGTNIVILPKEDQVLRQLDRLITKRFNNVDVGQVLTELSESAGLEFRLEAGALQRVPPEFRHITLILDNAKIRQALEEIRGVTGLDYTVKADGVYLWNQNPPLPATTMQIPPGGPIVATLQLDNGMQLFLRQNDMPADILEYAEHKKLQEFTRLRQQMKDEKFVPTPPATQPTTKPAETAPAQH